MALQIREKPRTVSKELLRLEATAHVINVRGSGWYRAFLDPELMGLAERPEPSLHALQMACIAPLSGGLPVPRGSLQATLHPDKGWVASFEDGSAVRREWVRGRGVTFQAFKSGQVLVSVGATSSPISFEEWSEFWPELRGYAKGLGLDLEGPLSRLVNVEFNADWRAYFLSGIQRLKVTAFKRVWAQVYQKHRDALRLELRVAPTDLSVVEAAVAIQFLAQSPVATHVRVVTQGRDPSVGWDPSYG